MSLGPVKIVAPGARSRRSLRSPFRSASVGKPVWLLPITPAEFDGDLGHVGARLPCAFEQVDMPADYRRARRSPLATKCRRVRRRKRQGGLPEADAAVVGWNLAVRPDGERGSFQMGGDLFQEEAVLEDASR